MGTEIFKIRAKQATFIKSPTQSSK